MLSNMDGLDTIPSFLEKDELVKSTFEKARVLDLPKEEQIRYEDSLKRYRDLTNVVDTAFDESAATMQHERNEAIKRAEEADARAEALLVKLKKLQNKMTKKCNMFFRFIPPQHPSLI